MSAFTSLLGETILSSGGSVQTDQLATNKVVGLYFSAHWCPPCRGFTPKLADTYKAMKAAGKEFEIVFVSSDKNQAAFDEYFAEMPWMALPYEDRDRKAALSKKYKVSGIPSLVLLDQDGNTLHKDGRTVVTADPTGDEFPWPKKSLTDILGDKFLTSDGEEVGRNALGLAEGKTIGIYFSAHWCPPCRNFTPDLITTYNKIRSDGKPFEIIFASSDRSQEAFDEYFDEMPWMALPYEDRKRKEELSSFFGVSGIPTLVILDSDLNVITTSGRGAVGGDAEGAEFPWHPKPVNDLESGASGLNDETCVIALLDGVPADVAAAAEVGMEALAVEHAALRKSTDGAQGMLFFTAKSPGRIVDQIRALCKLEAAGEQPVLLMLDIPDDGGFYVSDALEGGVTDAALRTFVDAYSSKTLTRQQLSRG